MNRFIKRTMHSPRWQWARPALEYLFADGNDQNQWFRQVMNQVTAEWFQKQNPQSLDVLELSGHNWATPGMFKSYRKLDYPEFDICEQSLDETFDVVVAEQVFEHLLWPYRAGRNVYKMVRSGGHFLISTPFLVRIHADPIDCSRWTETGLKHLLAECGFPIEKIQTGSWGNRACVKANLDRFVRRRWWHSLKNEPDCPVVVWAMAKK